MSASCVFAQSGEVMVLVTVKNGFLAVGDIKIKSKPADYSVPDSRLRQQLIKDVNSVFHGMGRLCTQAFDLGPDAECPPEATLVARLTTRSWEEAKQKWQDWQAADPGKRGTCRRLSVSPAPKILSMPAPAAWRSSNGG